MIRRVGGRRGGLRLATALLVAVTAMAGGCTSYQTTTRSVELDSDPDLVFRAAAATLLDDRQVFDLSDRTAGLVAAATRSPGYVGYGRTTFWVTPLGRERSFVVVQASRLSSGGEDVLQEKVDWLIRRLRQRCLAGGDIAPLDEDGDAEAEGAADGSR